MLPIAGTMVLYMSYKTVLFTAAKTIGLIQSILPVNNICYDLFQTALVESDVKRKVAKIHKLLLHINDEQPPFIKMAIDDILDSIILVNECIEQYKIAKEKHELKILNHYRTLNTDYFTKSIIININLFNIRCNDLVKMIQIMNGLHLTPKEAPKEIY